MGGRLIFSVNRSRRVEDFTARTKEPVKVAAGNPKILTAQMLGEVFNVKADTFTNAAGDEIIFPLKKN